MRVGRSGYARLGVAIGALFVVTTLGVAPAAAQQTGGKPSFKVTISPAYATAGQWTTFTVTVVNTSSPGTSLKSLQLTAPTGFRLQSSANSPWQHTGKIKGRTLSRQLSAKPRSKAQFNIRATAPAKCGKSVLRWSARAFQSAATSGPQLALQSALSSVGVTVVCPLSAACGGGAACSTNVITSVSTYGVVSNAGSGTLRQTLNVGNPLRCGAYRFRDPNWYDSGVTSSTPPQAGAPPIMDQISYTIKNASQNGVGFCLGASYEFTTASGTPAPAGKLPNGNAGFIGLLPMCSSGAPPCISTITQQPDASVKTGHDAVMTIKVPEQGDPWGGG
ncbi:MAG TPA: hypothetical protein VMG37_15870 [Solirubrobacteraceae bacterium]|nr:hypothetical protein [Solirubrobacteraceae bacterium]